MVEKVGILSSGLRNSDSSLTLKEMLGDESHLHNKKAGTSCPLFIMAEKVVIKSSGLRISFSSLTLKEMFGV